MGEVQKEKYWTDSKDESYSDEDRTKNFVEHIKRLLEFENDNPSRKILPPELKKLNLSLQELIGYLEKHPDMLKYEFGQDDKISKIKVDPSRTLTFFNDSINRQCNMSYGISEMLKILTSNSQSYDEWKSGGNVEVEMSNEDYCKDKGFTSMPGTLSRLDVLASDFDDNRSDTALHAGGRKSRRRRARKTRRGRNRKAKSKSKTTSKTRRRRRHSRVRKHKKNTYTRRR